MKIHTNQPQEISDRKHFIRNGIIAFAGITALNVLPGCKEKEDKDGKGEKEIKEKEGEGQEVSPPEDLMQEHGLLNRILLIYDNCRIKLINKESFDIAAVQKASSIIRT